MCKECTFGLVWTISENGDRVIKTYTVCSCCKGFWWYCKNCRDS